MTRQTGTRIISIYPQITIMAKLQVIRELQISGEIKSADPSKRRYCLLDLEPMGGTPGPMINLGAYNKPEWYVYTISKKFESKEEAERYSNEKKIRIANDTIVD